MFFIVSSCMGNFSEDLNIFSYIEKIVEGHKIDTENTLCARKHVRSVHRTLRVGPLHRASNAEEFCI